MGECGCKCKGGFGSCLLGVILGVIAATAVGILFSFGLIPITLNFIIIALVTSVVSLGVLLGTLYAVKINNGYDCATKCVCSSGKCILLGSIGTFLATTLALTVGVATATIAAIIFVTLAAFFFVVMLVSVVSLISCLIKETCR